MVSSSVNFNDISREVTRLPKFKEEGHIDLIACWSVCYNHNVRKSCGIEDTVVAVYGKCNLAQAD